MKPLVIIFQSKKELYSHLTNILSEQLKKKPASVLGLSTGKTMLPLYSNPKFRKLNFAKVKTFNHDEYLTPAKNLSLSIYMKKYFISKTNMKKENFHILPHDTANPKKACQDYEKAVANSEVDFQILGLGRNGHIGFNEPGSAFSSKTRVVKLTDSTQKANKIKIKKAMTIGIATILRAKRIVLIATGSQKAKAVKCLLESPASTKCPASVLRTHSNATILLDKKAASRLSSA